MEDFALFMYFNATEFRSETIIPDLGTGLSLVLFSSASQKDKYFCPSH